MAALKKTPTTAVAVKPKTQIATIERSVKDLLKEATGQVVTIDRVSVEKKIKTIVKAKEKRVNELAELPELDKKQLTELEGIRSELREPRYALQNIEKHNTKVLNDAKRSNGAMLGEIIKHITPLEKVAHDKIELEKDRIQKQKEKEDAEEAARVQVITDKINEAGIFFEAELEKARKSNDWEAFDEYVKGFEAGLEDLKEYEFEGADLLEKYSTRKTEIVALIEQAVAQAEKDTELQAKEALLNAAANKAEEEKRRMFELFGLGFTFNGLEFSKDGYRYEKTYVDELTKEDFDKSIKEIKDTAAALVLYNALINEAEGLKLDVTVFKGVEDAEAVKNAIQGAKKAKTEAEAEAERLAAEKATKELREAGEIVCLSIGAHIQEMEEAVAPSELVNEEARGYVEAFFSKIKTEYDYLRACLNQPIEKEAQ